jgi:hypothetical protein
MKIIVSTFLCVTLLYLGSCRKFDVAPSTAVKTSMPKIVNVFANENYVLGVGSGLVFKSFPDTIGKIVDTLVGFEGGFGGKTGKDTTYILKGDLRGHWPDTTKAGGYSVTFEKLNLNNFRAAITANVVLAAPIASPNHPGPTDFSGTYLRTATGISVNIKKVFDGVYVIDNPGGGAVDLFPYLLYNYKNAAGNDSLAFSAQTNPCHGATKLVAVAAPLNLKVSEYDRLYPPGFTSLNPITLSWRVFEFPDGNPGTAHTGVALCQWGTGVRTLVKQ